MNKLDHLGYGPLHSLVKKNLKKSKKLDLLYTFLTESDVDVNLADQDGNTALHLAVKVCENEYLCIPACACLIINFNYG